MKNEKCTDPEHHDGKWDGATILKFGIISDTHFGSIYTQITHLHDFYDLCAREGIKDVYHTGDITDGLKMRPGHEYELYEISADGQCDDVIKNYPKRDGIVSVEKRFNWFQKKMMSWCFGWVVTDIK